METKLTEGFKNGWVISADGTRIGYRQIGNGPGLILLHGALQSSLNFTELAKALSADFSVYLPDRRGRGLSGPYLAGDDLLTEANDLLAIIHQTKTVNIFGLSSGAVITLQALLLENGLQKIALYEPPLAIAGHPFNKIEGPYQKALKDNNYGRAFVAILKGTGDDSLFSKLPAFITAPLINWQMKSQLKAPAEDEIPLRVLTENFSQDRIVINDSARLLAEIKDIQASILLLGGTKSTDYLEKALDSLQRIIPEARRIYLKGVGHIAADNSEQPLKVAEVLIDFFKF
jgi:pimeloyl-ACP methyl ester carboxylesterase